MEVLERVRPAHGRDLTIEVFADLGHDTTHDPEAIETMLAWIERTVASG